jgi:hypothetical protein
MFAGPLPDPDVSAGISLTVQLLSAGLLVILMVLVHAAGIIGATKLLKLEDRELRAHRVDLKAFGLLTMIALSLFALHMIEISGFALFYQAIGAVKDFETALYFSASAYTTLGHPDVQFPDDWRLVGAIEGLVGFLLIGWSTAVFITDMNKLLRAEEVE